ncbi:unnamed protein product [Mytilus coruscus]|uniref:Uncharacterized protein n=1 Tax=Mytilus coruscus TaxID=42192 RepID=A0A6J8A4L5_MYTCO|nr:unnamed protein product [Mytilus coruscus]
MPTLPLPLFPRLLELEIRAATFAFSRPLNTTEKKFEQERFRKKPDGSIECVSCGIEKQVNLNFSIYNSFSRSNVTCKHVMQTTKKSMLKISEKNLKNINWTIYEVARLHEQSCDVQREKLDYISRRSILINARRSRGTYTFSNKVIKEALMKGFSSARIMNAAIRFFVEFGAYPEISDLIEYILC